MIWYHDDQKRITGKMSSGTKSYSFSKFQQVLGSGIRGDLVSMLRPNRPAVPLAEAGQQGGIDTAV
ncbi:MAG: hypothetical protein ACLFSB_09855 [Chitinispirillaceae bacterium]